LLMNPEFPACEEAGAIMTALPIKATAKESAERDFAIFMLLSFIYDFTTVGPRCSEESLGTDSGMGAGTAGLAGD
jgi:hypothetical protein